MVKHRLTIKTVLQGNIGGFMSIIKEFLGFIGVMAFIYVFVVGLTIIYETLVGVA